MFFRKIFSGSLTEPRYIRRTVFRLILLVKDSADTYHAATFV